jgi:hypothetical protein
MKYWLLEKDSASLSQYYVMFKKILNRNIFVPFTLVAILMTITENKNIFSYLNLMTADKFYAELRWLRQYQAVINCDSKTWKSCMSNTTAGELTIWRYPK